MGAVAAVRDKTRASHTRLESRLTIAHPGAGTSELHDYFEHLSSWLLPRDTWTWSRPWPAQLHADKRLEKRAWLEADLQELREMTQSSAPKPPAVAPPAGDDELDLLASAYVVEGSMLGGRVLRRKFEHLGFESRFFEGYGEDTGPLWMSLLNELESAASTDARKAKLASAAERVFDDLCLWMQTSEAVWT